MREFDNRSGLVNLHKHDYPDTIHIHEHKAPTDASIRYMEEAHDKAMKNIIAKVEVEDNLISGELFCFHQPYNASDCIKIIVRFKINGKEFNVEKEIPRSQIMREDQRLIADWNSKLQDMGSSIILWYTLKMLTANTFEQITGRSYPEHLLK